MAKSRLIKANRKIEKAVTGIYQAIEKKTTGSYQAIENAFISRCLTKDGESISEAKERLEKKHPSQY